MVFFSGGMQVILISAYNFNLDNSSEKTILSYRLQKINISPNLFPWNPWNPMGTIKKKYIKGKTTSPFSVKKWNHHNLPNSNYGELINTKYYEMRNVDKKGYITPHLSSRIDSLKYSG